MGIRIPQRPPALVVAVALSLCGACVTAGDAGGRPPTPNILIIITDDQTRGLEVMPSVKQLFAREGKRFPNAFATTPLCCPSRASIYSGLYAHNHGVFNNFEAEDLDQSETIQAALHDAGYRTGLFGKFFNHWDVERAPSYFDEWAMFPAPRNAAYYEGAEWNVNGEVQEVQEYATGYIEERGVEFLEATEASDEQPWLAVIATTAPHYPFTPEARYADVEVPPWDLNPAVGEKDRRDKPGYVRRADCLRRCGAQKRAAQLRTLMSVDDLVERLFGTLDELGENRDTLAFYLSDNGQMWGEHGLGDKRVPYLPSIQIPLLMRWPGHIEPSTDNRLVANIDVAPTVLAATGVSQPGDRPDGMSLLRGRDRRRLFIEYQREPRIERLPESVRTPPSWRSVVTDGRQFIGYYAPGGELIGKELYDLREDPWQLDNLFAPSGRAKGKKTSRPELPVARATLKRLKTILRTDAECTGKTCP